MLIYILLIGIMQPASLNFDNEQNPNWKDVHNIFKLSVIASATNNFSDDNKIGQGGFGSVYKVHLHFFVFNQACQSINQIQNEHSII